MKIIWKKPTWTKKRVLMAAAGVFVLAAIIASLCLLLRGKPEDPLPSPTAPPAVSASPSPSPQPVTPSPTPEPMITPPALQSGSAASGSDIQVSIQLPATDSDLTP